MLSFQSSPSHLPVLNSYAEVFTKKWIAKIPNECGYQRGLSNKDDIRQQSWQVFTGTVLHRVQSRCSVINLVSAVTLGPNGVSSHLACRTAEPFSGSWVLATCSSVLQPFRSFPNLFWLIHQLFYNARVPPAVFLLTSDVQTFVMGAACSHCRVWAPLQSPGCITRDWGNTLFLEHLYNLFDIFSSQKLQSRISSLTFIDSSSSGLNRSLRDKPNSVGFLCRVQLVHSLQRMLLLVRPPPTSWVFPEHRSLSHGDTHSLRLWVHSFNVCLLSWWQPPCFPGWLETVAV